MLSPGRDQAVTYPKSKHDCSDYSHPKRVMWFTSLGEWSVFLITGSTGRDGTF